MKNLLTISSSYRSKGNGDSLLSLCVKDLSESGHKFTHNKIYLKDYRIENCIGCMNCAINKSFCKIEDDLKNFIDQILSCDVLVISSPVYFLGAISKIKSINDRLLYLHNIIDFSQKKPAGIIITAGRVGWEGTSIQDLSILLLSMGFQIKDILIMYGQGPSEVLLDTNIDKKIKQFTHNLVKIENNTSTISDKCPICFGNSFNIMDKNKIRCPVCNITGEVISPKNNKTLILFSENDINNCRWTKDNLKEHMETWVGKSGKRYKEKVKEILKRRKQLLNS